MSHLQTKYARSRRALNLISLLAGAFAAPLVAWAAFNDVVVNSEEAVITLPGTSKSYTLTRSTRVESFVVNQSSISFTMLEGSIVEIFSTDRHPLVVSSGCEIIVQTCDSTRSTIAVQCSNSNTITITPTNGSTCDTTGGGSGGSGGGGGGGSRTPLTTTPSAPSAARVVTNVAVDRPTPVVVGSSSHTVTVVSATAKQVTVRIASEPVTITLAQGEIKDVDTNADGKNDLRVRYIGLSGKEPQLEFIELGAVAASAGTSSKPREAARVVVNLTVGTPMSVAVGLSTHTVTVVTSTAKQTTVRVDPVTITLAKGEIKDVDTNGDGKNDLQVHYVGLSGKQTQVEFIEILVAAPAAVATPAPVPTSGVACALEKQMAYKRPGSAAVYYITTECTKRAFNNSRVFFTYFDKWSDVKSTAKGTLDGIGNDTLGFMPWGPNFDPQYGALVKIVTDPKTYLLLGTEKYWITSEDVFIKLGYQWNWIEDIDSRLLDKYATGSEINYLNRHPNFTLVKYAGDPKVYRLEADSTDAAKQVKRHIKDEKAFKSLKYRWDRIVTLTDSEQYTEGDQLTAQ